MPGQYADDSNLAARRGLHARYGTRDWWGWLRGHADLRPGARVLDVGCGSGWFWERPDCDAAEITLVDTSPGMLSEAAPRCAAHQPRTRVTTIEADVCALPFEDDSFDRVLAVQMLYHATDPDRGLSEIARVLHPGGCALISANSVESFALVDDIIETLWGPRPFGKLAARFGIDDPARVAAHFADVRLESFGELLDVRDPEGLVAYICSFPPGQGASPEEGARLRAEIAARHAKTGLKIDKRQGAFLCTKREDKT